MAHSKDHCRVAELVVYSEECLFFARPERKKISIAVGPSGEWD